MYCKESGRHRELIFLFPLYLRVSREGLSSKDIIKSFPLCLCVPLWRKVFGRNEGMGGEKRNREEKENIFPKLNFNFLFPLCLCVSVAILIFVPPAAGISSEAGTSGAQFLKIDMGARHAALGGTYSGYGTDVFTLWGNPASLAFAPSSYQLGAQHTEWFQGVTQDYVGVAGRFWQGRAAVTFNTVGVDNLTR
ncbi:hypothetical protein D6779_10500, partial [Candidatus Parcubacteria bacterium]